MDQVPKIIINELEQKKMLLCYAQKEFSEKGWCKVRGKTSDPGAWGFCSPSCNKLKVLEYTIQYVIQSNNLMQQRLIKKFFNEIIFRMDHLQSFQ